MDKYTINFKGGQTQTDKFKGELYGFVRRSITRFFMYDGDELKIDCTDDDIHRLKIFVSRFGGETIVE